MSSEEKTESEERFLRCVSRLLRRSEGEEEASAYFGRNDCAVAWRRGEKNGRRLTSVPPEAGRRNACPVTWQCCGVAMLRRDCAVAWQCCGVTVLWRGVEGRRTSVGLLRSRRRWVGGMTVPWRGNDWRDDAVTPQCYGVATLGGQCGGVRGITF